MYEIWLVMNILWEIALGLWPLLAAGGIAWLVLLRLALRSPAARWRSAAPPALGLAFVAALIGFLAVPAATKSSLQELSYWVDWANLAAISLGIGAAALAFAWPGCVVWRRNIIVS